MQNTAGFSVTNHRIQFAWIMWFLSLAAVNTWNAEASVSGDALFIVKADMRPQRESLVSVPMGMRGTYF